MAILSVQSTVAYGHVGNAAAVFPLQRLGHEVWPVYTVQFSNHPGYPTFRGAAIDGAAVAETLRGVAERDGFAALRGVLSGYLGDPDNVAAVAETVDRARAGRPGLVYCCDPVMGDTEEGLYVRPDLPPLIRDVLVPRATIVTPNAFELSLLTGRATDDEAEVLAAAGALLAAGPEVVLATSLCFCADRATCTTIETVAVSRAGAWRVVTPRLEMRAKGSGDVLAALFLARYLDDGAEVPRALSDACSALYAVIDATAEAGAGELLLVAAQERLVAPPRRFDAEKLNGPKVL